MFTGMESLLAQERREELVREIASERLDRKPGAGWRSGSSARSRPPPACRPRERYVFCVMPALPRGPKLGALLRIDRRILWRL